MTESKIIKSSGSGGLEKCIEIWMNNGWNVVNAFYANEDDCWCALLTREVDPCD